MLKILFHGLAILHLGPGIAFALLAFGCEPGQAWLGRHCAIDGLRAFAELTLAGWLACLLLWGAGWALLRRRAG